MGGIPFFRGHASSEWELTPSLGRLALAAMAKVGYDELFKFESTLHSRFAQRGARLLPDDDDGWATLLAMQHHGLPTRLLDWSLTFAIALHFALTNPAHDEAAIWILNPYELNQTTRQSVALIDAPSVGDYGKLYCERDAPKEPDVIAITATEHSPRLLGQHAVFTLHNRLDMALEALHPTCLRKITIPSSAYKDARQFLYLGGVSEFALFPDLDGLARELRRTFCFD